jgi:hypothetical protein
MFEPLAQVRRFDEALDDTSGQATPIRRRADPYVVGDANDAAERRADEVADRGLAILRASRSTFPAAATAPATSTSRIQRATPRGSVGLGGGAIDDSLSTTLDGAIGTGRRFESSVQRDIRRATGRDAGNVNLHTDVRADRLARSMQASAFTVDNNVFFARGEYRPDTEDGMHTVLHESAHLAEGAGRVQRKTIRRKVAVTPADLDGSFKHATGLRGISKAMGSDEIPKIRNALKRYHAAKPGSSRQLEELRILMKLGDEWLRKHPKVQDRADQSRMELIESVRTQAGMEFGKLQAASIYMNAGAAAADAKSNPGSKAGPGALTALEHGTAFSGTKLYDERSSVSNGSKGKAATTKRNNLVKAGELAALSPEAEAALTAGIESLSPAEFASIHTYTGSDYSYINPNVGQWGKGGKEKYEEAGLHGGFIAEAFRKLPLWQGNTYKGMTMSTDYLGLTSSSSYKANDFWSTSEARSIAKRFLTISATTGKNVTMAAICTVNVSNGRDVSRMSDAPDELEILLPPGSIYRIGNRRCLQRGKDDAEIKDKFGALFFDGFPAVTQFWLIDLKQTFSSKDDTVGAYQRPGTFNGGKAAKPTSGARDFANPWVGMSGKRVLNI